MDQFRARSPPAQRFRKAQVETRVVDQDDGVRLEPLDFRERSVEALFKKRVVPKHIDDADHACLIDPIVDGRGERAHFWPAEPGKLHIGAQRPQRAEQLLAARIAARLAGDEVEPHCARERSISRVISIASSSAAVAW